MEQVENSLRSLTRGICGQLNGVEIPKMPVWTVVGPPDAAPHVALDAERPALSDLRYSLSIGLGQLAEYKAVAAAVEIEPELAEGIIVDAGGFLREPDEINNTRALVTNFLWRYLRAGTQLYWDETRFVETYHELRAELRQKSVVFHTILPLSNLKVDVTGLDFGDALTLRPAAIGELERWLNPDRSLPALGAGPPQWNTLYVDRPAVLHAHQTVVGQPLPTDLQQVQLPRVNVDHVITALRLVMNVPISVIFQEHYSDGLMAFGGRNTSWGSSPPLVRTLAALDLEKGTQVIHVWDRLKTSRNTTQMRLSLRRWESSLLRETLEDRLIDAWISLEALLLRGSDGELKYRGAVRLGEFLGTSGVDRKAIYDLAKISYDWRSVIVHGGSSKKVAKRQPLEETVRYTTEYLRSALLKVLDLPDPFDPNKLDSLVKSLCRPN